MDGWSIFVETTKLSRGLVIKKLLTKNVHLKKMDDKIFLIAFLFCLYLIYAVFAPNKENYLKM